MLWMISVLDNTGKDLHVCMKIIDGGLHYSVKM